jgi:predicted RNA-binding protein with PIN domain
VSLHFVVDGYNVIRYTDRFAAGLLRDQRDALLGFIENAYFRGSAPHRVTVVFDGRSEATSPAWGGNVRVVFSRGVEADAVIKARVDEMADPSQAVVVTDDRAIQRWVRGAGARVMSAAEFLRAGSPASSRPPRSGGMSPSETDAVNEELKRLWKLK